MNITKEQFLEKLIEHSQLPREVVEQELNDFINEASGVVKGNPISIEDMGIFRLKKGRLSFETDPKLALEINYKYAGMLPIEVKKGTSSSFEDDSSDENSENLVKQEEDNEKIQIGKVREPKKEEEPKPVVEIQVESVSETTTTISVETISTVVTTTESIALESSEVIPEKTEEIAIEKHVELKTEEIKAPKSSIKTAVPEKKQIQLNQIHSQPKRQHK
jgi:nucleoid DNA-binding protein